ncbi:hypothetical protein MKW92_043972 [Papaver armeniacum]|nr:hypothetical protein MKW92_043972 [Papaver armeniacum]
MNLTSKLFFFFFSLITFLSIYTNKEVSEFLVSLRPSISEHQPSVTPDSNEYVWKVENFSSLSNETYHSEDFSAHGVNWCLSIYPKGVLGTYHTFDGPQLMKGTHLVIFLHSLDTSARYTRFSFAIINQKNMAHTRKLDGEGEFRGQDRGMGFYEAMPLKELVDPGKGYLVCDTLYIKVEVISTLKIIKSSPALTTENNLLPPAKTETQFDDSKLTLNMNLHEDQSTKGEDDANQGIFRLFQFLGGFQMRKEDVSEEQSSHTTENDLLPPAKTETQSDDSKLKFNMNPNEDQSTKGEDNANQGIFRFFQFLGGSQMRKEDVSEEQSSHTTENDLLPPAKTETQPDDSKLPLNMDPHEDQSTKGEDDANQGIFRFFQFLGGFQMRKEDVSEEQSSNTAGVIKSLAA